MISHLLFSLLACPTLSPPTLIPPTAVVAPRSDEAEAAIAAAGKDVEKLLELAATWKEEKKNADAKLAYKAILEIDDANEIAHKGLRHQFYDNQWFKSYSAMSKYKRKEAKLKSEQGFSLYNKEWVKSTDLPYLRMGWAKDANGMWADPVVIARAEHEAKMTKDGYQLRQDDSTWIHPDDFPKWKEGKFKVNDKWVSVEEANAHHSGFDTWWRARAEHFTVLTTLPYENMLWARWHADAAYADLLKLYGEKPNSRPELVVLKDMAEFNLFAAGSQEGQGRRPAEASGFSSLHYAYFADSWYDATAQPPRFLGTGVAYWDTGNEAMAPFGRHSIRHAAGLAYAEAITPSLNAIAEAISSGSTPDLEAFWSEKPIPRWLFYGGASYVGRYFIDSEAENPNWAREWSITNVRKGGELDSLESIFAFDLSLERIEASTRLINEAGLLVSFIMDGACEPVVQAHRAYKIALRKKRGTKEAIKALQDAILANKKAFVTYVKAG